MQNWYQDFFTELPNAFWRAAVPAEATAAEVDFLINATGAPPGGAVLDMPCGSGRHALELARRGFRVTGVDISAEAIGHGREAAAAEGLAVDLRVGDMADPVDDKDFDLAVCLGNAFGYLEHDGTLGFLRHVAAAVRPGGALVIDSGFVAESLFPGLSLEEEPMTIGGVEATSVNTYDAAESRWLTDFTFRRGDEVHTGTSVQHVYTSAEIARMVRGAGFGDVHLFGGPGGAPYAFGSSRLLLVATK